MASTVPANFRCAKRTITLTKGQLEITEDLTILGPGADVIHISGTEYDEEGLPTGVRSRVIHVNSGIQLDVFAVTLRDGYVDGDGAGILNDGDLTLSQVVMTNNRTAGDFNSGNDGGAIYNNGTLVAPIDALIPINALNLNGAGPLDTPTSPGALPEFYLDTNGDRFSAPIDVLVVINALNISRGAAAEGEASEPESSSRLVLSGPLARPTAQATNPSASPLRDARVESPFALANPLAHAESYGEDVDRVMRTPPAETEVAQPLEALLDDLAADVAGRLL